MVASPDECQLPKGALEQCKDSWHLLSQHLLCWCGGCAPLRDASKPSVATHGSSTAPTAPCGALAVLHDVLALDIALSTLITREAHVDSLRGRTCGFNSRTGSE